MTNYEVCQECGDWITVRDANNFEMGGWVWRATWVHVQSDVKFCALWDEDDNRVASPVMR